MADLNVGNGATTTVDSDASYGGVFLGSGSTLVIDGATVSTDYLDAGSHSLIKVTGGATFDNTGWTGGSDVTFEVEGSSTLTFSIGGGGGGGINGSTIVFSGSGDGTVNLPAQVSGLDIQGFGSGDQLHFADDDIASFNTVTNDDGSVTIQSIASWGGVLSSVTVSGNFNPADLILDPSTGTVGYACFLAGTRIATPEGFRVVEDLVIGDLVLGADGRARPVRWIGRQSVIAMFADPFTAYPIRVAAGALGDNLPARDLFLSPDHALLIDGLLVQAGALVNGSTVSRVERPEARFTYFHIELADHALILAEGMPAETFVDNVTRRRFDNHAEYEALYGSEAPAIDELDLPRVKSARQLPPALRTRLAGRAAAQEPAAAA
ncbi:Hint domain-containing protein [Ancylobacter oerskovii]|uniref:Hint domain-containing protein n=1 Tax=Ancylobacter oerskovii TaxID=459519 RepID=A0ABW4YSN5_9HYPH|nr:Hint domain-containing protein [Ancylobacter oerskovii]MBS7545267.1 Hint domain-containing protein [Ancylobacter oerskovii]